MTKNIITLCLFFGLVSLALSQNSEQHMRDRIYFGTGTGHYVEKNGNNLKFKDPNNDEKTLTEVFSGAVLPDTRGLTLTSNSTNPYYQVDLHADWILAVSSDGSSAQTTTGFDELWDLTADLDTGSEGSSRWYYGWLVYESSTWTPYFSESASAVSGVAATTPRIRMFSVYNDGSSNFRKFSGFGRARQYWCDGTNTGWPIAHNADVGPSDEAPWTALDLSGTVPSHATEAWGGLNSTNGADMMLSVYGYSEIYSWWSSQTTNGMRFPVQSSNTDDWQWRSSFRVRQTIYGKAANTSPRNMVLSVGGFYEDHY